MNCVVVLQARTNSSRLPAKSLLPIQNIPLVILAAKRAANTGITVIIATSKCDSDDELSSIVKKNNLPLFRGSLNNTLSRFVKALKNYDNNTIVFRLTADNVFPDGSLLDEIRDDFIQRNLKYICCNGSPSGLPYGVSVEVTRLIYLREALRETSDLFDQEHVMPFIVKKFGLQYFTRYQFLKKEHYRCTIDSLDDYLSVVRAFDDVANPISISLFVLVKNLNQCNYQPVMLKSVPSLILGTAQLGMTYGIANTIGKPAQTFSEKIIKTAIANGVCYLDAAQAYGDCEKVIGRSLKNDWQNRVKVITKLSPLSECSTNASKQTIDALVESSVYRSVCALQRQDLDILMLHRASHLYQWKNSVWKKLLNFKVNGLIQELGVSVQNKEELERALFTDHVTYIQMPFNIFDWRLDKLIPKILSEKRKRNIIIHVRSSLLQGLLQSDKPALWEQAGIKNHQKIIKWLEQQVVEYDRKNIIDLCLNYVRSFDWIDGVVVGVDNIQQLHDNIEYFNLEPLNKNEVESIQEQRPKLDKNSLNPALWSSLQK